MLPAIILTNIPIITFPAAFIINKAEWGRELSIECPDIVFVMFYVLAKYQLTADETNLINVELCWLRSITVISKIGDADDDCVLSPEPTSSVGLSAGPGFFSSL